MSQSEASLKDLDERLKAAIQTLYYIQSGVHGYQGQNTAEHLKQQILNLEPELTALAESNLPKGLPDVTPEILEYVDLGRNPDIYTREFVEIAQRTNAYVKGKKEALTELRDTLAEEILTGLGPELLPLVERATGRVSSREEEAVVGKGEGESERGIGDRPVKKEEALVNGI